MNITAYKKPEILFFDVNETLLDLTKTKVSIAKLLNGKEELLPLWFTTMLQYSLVTSASGQYKPFGTIGAAALQMVAANHHIHISEEKAKEVISSTMQNLPPHKDVIPALKTLKKAGYKLVAFSNSTTSALKNQLQNAGIADYFINTVSVENTKKYKPHTETYHWAAHKMKTDPKNCMLIAAHGWDVAGAMWAGFRAAFLNRPGQQKFPLAPNTEITKDSMQEIAEVLISYH